MPLGRGAIARSIMAHLPRPQLLPLIARNLEDLRTVGLGASVDEVLQNLKKVRKAGFAVAYGEVTPGAVGIAAPVLDDRRMPMASICVTIGGHQLTGSLIERISAGVKSAATAISKDHAADLDHAH